MNRKLFTVMLGAAAFAVGATSANSASAQWRTHYVHRDGLFHVERLHTGNGLTPVGGAVLMTGINAFAPIVGDIVTKDAVTTRDRSDLKADAAAYDRYRSEIESAHQLLRRTASLVNDSDAGGGESEGGDAHHEEQAGLEGLGDNPWNARPGRAATPAKPQKPNGGAGKPTETKNPWPKRPNS